ncbi:MAG: SMC-Scp complex subunit ScpB [Gammaproteobacteria bacterium]|nr:SMC-Scp complex subunit ScpB [Gammaproteobacteria bacterium]
MNPEKLKNIFEAALMTSNGTMNVNRFVSLFEKDIEQPEKDEVKAALAQLQQDYEDRGIELKEVSSGYRFQVRQEYADWVNRLFDEKPQRYSRALLETLAIIAYRQPITRGEIEDIRGVSISSSIIKTLQEREWIRVVGHRDVPGKPELLATSKHFLDYFNLKKLSDLPSLAEIKDFDKLNPDLFEGLEEPAQEVSDSGETEGAVAETEDDESTVVLELVDGDNLDDEEVKSAAEEGDEEDVASSADNVVPFSN